MSQSTETIHRVAQVLAGAERGGAENFFVRLVKGLQATGKVNQQAFIRAHQHRIDALESGGVPTRGFRFGGQSWLTYTGSERPGPCMPEWFRAR